MTQDFRSKHGYVVPCVRLPCDMEVLMSILRELFEKEGEEGINVLARSNSIANRSSTVRIACIDRLIEKYDRSV